MNARFTPLFDFTEIVLWTGGSLWCIYPNVSLVITDMEKTKVLCKSFISAFKGSQASHVPSPWTSRLGVREPGPSHCKKIAGSRPPDETEQAQGSGPWWSHGPERTDSCGWKSLSILFEKSWWAGENLSDLKKIKFTSILKKGIKEKQGTIDQCTMPLFQGRSWNIS